MAAVLADKGHSVIGVDVNEAFVNALEEGRGPVRETGLVYASAETSYWRPPTAQCRQWYAEGRFGRIVYMEGEYLHDAVHATALVHVPAHVAEHAAIEGDRAGDTLETLVRS